MHKTGKKLLSVLLALAMVLSLLPGAALRAAADDVTYVQITSTPTAETLANMITYSQDAALAIYNSAEFQAGAGPNGGIVLIYNVGEADGEYMVIHNAPGTPEVMSVALDTIGMLLQYGFNVYIVQPGGSVTPPDPPANPAVYYQYYTLNTADWSITPVVESTTNYTLVTSSNSNWNSGWYVVSGDVTINELVEFSGTVRLILCDGASLTVTEGIWATAEGSKLIIYPGVMDSGAKAAPTIEGSGALHANASYPSEPGIGGDETLELEIHGGVIEATGGNGAAGIGGGYGRSGCTVTIYGGSVTATGGSNGAGIGGADGANGGNVSIYGGTVNAIGGPFAVGIGAGYEGVSDGELNFNSEGILLETSDDNLSWSVYSDGAPRGRYMRAQVIEEQPPAAFPSADEGFFDDFEGEFTWTIQNGSQTNAWYLGEAVNNGGSKALYVSNDGGASNTYTVYKSSFVFVEKTFSFEGGNYNFAYDWRGDGESAYDFIRMALIPVDFEVTAGSTYPVDFSADGLPEGWISIDGGAKLNLQSEWQHDVYEDVQVPAGLYRAAIIWVNDTSAGTQPAGAIDNFSIAPGNYTPVEGPVSADAGYTDDFEGINTWTLHNGEQINAWYVGDAVYNGGGKALYVSKDGGFTNAYDIYSPAFVFADKLFRFDGGAYDFAYDWRCGGEENWDYLRVALIPEDAAPTAGAQQPNGFSYNSFPSGWIPLDNNGQLVNQTNWQHLSIEGLEVPAGDYYVAFLWRNDDSVGNEIPAAIDNFSVEPHIDNPQTVDVYLIDQTNPEPSDVRIWAWGSAGDLASDWDSRPAMEYQDSDAVVNREGVNGEPYTRPYYKFTLNVDDFGNGLLFTGPNGQSGDCALTDAQKEAGFAVFYLYYADNGLGASAGNDVWKLVSHTDADCTQPAIDEYRGMLTGTTDSIERSPALGHDFSVLLEDHPATCTETGYQIYKCSRCEAVESRPVDALGHDYVPAVTEPSCTEGGFTTYTCSRCGDSYEDDFTEALGHDFGEWSVSEEPSCTEAGEEVRICARCSETETRPVDALGHDYVPAVTEPSCTEGGFTTYTCSRCGDSYEDDFTEALGHDFGEWTVTAEPSCTEAGEEVRICARCGETETQTLDALGHQPGEPVVENYVEPTGSAEGGYDTVVYCQRCSEELSREHTTLSSVDGPNADGYFYLGGEIVPRYQFVEWEGAWYFINDYDKYARDIHLDFKPIYVEGTPFEPGCYYFDAMGRLVIQNGPQANGYFYLNGIRQKAYQLIEWNGDYYFINDGHKYARNIRLYLGQQFVEGSELAPGCYDFDDSGKLVLKNGPWEDGYFYINGIRQKAYQLIEWNGDYYFINDAHKYARNIRLYLGQRFVEGSELAPGYYDFDDSGKLVIKNGPQPDGYFYINGARQSCYQLIHWEGGYYFINDAHKYAVNTRIYLSARFIGDEPIAVGYHYFGEDGRMILD